MTTERTLHDAHRDLRAAVQRLVDPIVSRRLSPTGVVAHRVPSLLDQLRDWVAATGANSTGGGGRAHSPAPIAVDAHDLLTSIETYTKAELWREEPGEAYVGTTLAGRVPVRELGTAERIRRCADFVRANGVEPEHLDWLTDILRDWAQQIEAMDDPTRRPRPIRGVACPACGVAWVDQLDQAGEIVWTPALHVSPRGETRCASPACGHRWHVVDMYVSATAPHDAEPTPDVDEQKDGARA